MRLLERSLALFEDVGHQIGIAFVNQAIGDADRAAGEFDAAIGPYRQAIDLHRRLNMSQKVIECIEDATSIIVTRNAATAARLLGAMDACRAETGTARPPGAVPAWERAVATTRDALGPARFAAEWQVGQLLTVDAAAVEAVAALDALLDALPETSVAGETADGDATGNAYGLTPREIDVLRLLAAGKSNPAIAADLFITVGTAKGHVHTILAKLGVNSRAAAAVFAHRQGLA